MSDSIDRVFAHALRTVRRLPRYGSSKPPSAARLRLYGLYKQSMEGDVGSLLPRPTLPRRPSSPSRSALPTPDGAEEGRTQDHQDTMTRRRTTSMERERDNEIKGETEKWDAWYACRGISRTEAKRRYIEVLIQTMKVYAAGTVESRELVGELEFVWEQVKSVSGNEESLRGTRRSGVVVGVGGEEEATEGRLRVLSPVSRGGGSDEIVEGEDASIPERKTPQSDDDNEDEDNGQDDEDARDAPPSSKPKNDNSTNDLQPLDRRRKQSPSSPAATTRKWRHQIELALTKISTELAALREQIDELHSPPSSSSFSSSPYYSSRSAGRRKRSARLRILIWLRWLFWLAVKQLTIDAAVLALLLLWGVWREDARVERWVGRRWVEARGVVEEFQTGKRKWAAEWRSRLDFWRVLARILPARVLS